jgi:hypothetical protein
MVFYVRFIHSFEAVINHEHGFCLNFIANVNRESSSVTQTRLEQS